MLPDDGLRSADADGLRSADPDALRSADPDGFRVTFEWFDDKGNRVGEPISLTGEEWDAMYRWCLRLTPKALRWLETVRVGRLPISTLAEGYELQPPERVFATVEDLNAYVDSLDIP